MKVDDFKGLKRTLSAERAIKGWENAHVDKSGNFGYTVVKDGKWFNVIGRYDGQGKVQDLRVVTYGGTDFQDIDKSKSFAEAARIIDNYIVKH